MCTFLNKYPPINFMLNKFHLFKTDIQVYQHRFLNILILGKITKLALSLVRKNIMHLDKGLN